MQSKITKNVKKTIKYTDVINVEINIFCNKKIFLNICKTSIYNYYKVINSINNYKQNQRNLLCQMYQV